MTLLQHHLLALGLITATTSTMGTFILWQDPKKSTNRIFAIYTFSITWWSLWEFLLQFSPSQSVATLRLHIEYLGVCFAPTLFYQGVLSLVSAKKKAELAIYYALSISFTVLIVILGHPLFISSALPVAYLPFLMRGGPLFFLFLFFFAFAVVRAHQLLWVGYHKEPLQRKRKQLKYLFFSSVLAYVAPTSEFLLKLGIRIPYLQPFGLYSVPLYVVLVAYTIIQFELFDIHVVIRKSLVYSLLVTLLTASYFGLLYGVERIFQTTFGYHSVWLSLIAFGLMTLLFQPLKIGIQHLVDWIIFRVPQEQLAKRMERLEEQALQGEKLKAISTLAAGMAHEIKNPLTALKTFGEFIPEKGSDPEFRKKLHEIFTTETQRIHNIVQEVLDFAKPKPPQFKFLEIGSLLTSTVDLLSSDLLKHHIQWTVSCHHNGAAVQADADQLRQILINLIQNAADAMPDGGTLTLSTQAINGYLELAVSDTGDGIPKELLPKIFDPFVTTKPNGTGLGLAMVQTLVRAHRGSISVASTPARGTTFTLRFPL